MMQKMNLYSLVKVSNFATGKPNRSYIKWNYQRCHIVDLRFNKVLMYREMLVGIATLPAENKMENKFGISNKKEIDKFGIGKYNSECKKMVFTCVDSWKDMAAKK